MIVKIEASVYCNIIDAENTAYRLYIDNDLYTERTFVWNRRDTYIEECSYADLEPGDHKIRVESCKIPNGFVLKDIRVDSKSVSETFTINT